MGWVTECLDDLVSEGHSVRMVMAVVEKLDVSRFCEPIKAREGRAGRDATDPQLLVGLWLYAAIRGIGSALRGERAVPLAIRRGNGESPHAVGFPHRSRRCAGRLFTQVIASLVDQGRVGVSRISQDGVRVRVSAGASRFHREQRRQELLRQAKRHVQEVRRQLENPAGMAGVSARQKAARKRAAEEKQQRLKQAMAQLPELKQKQEEAEKRAGQGQHGQKVRERQPRVSTTPIRKQWFVQWLFSVSARWDSACSRHWICR
jgi:hypothetical protein